MFETPLSNRIQIGIFGRRNSGKSSLINALTGQNLAIVSKKPGTTTDPVYKSIEILPLGPCTLIDTAGIDDHGTLGEERVAQTLKVLRKVDVGLIVLDASKKMTKVERDLIKLFSDKKLPMIVIFNKSDLVKKEFPKITVPSIKVSSLKGEGIYELKELLINTLPHKLTPIPLLKDLVKPKDEIVLVCPIDSGMPQGRLILPQVQVMREILDSNGIVHLSKDSELKETLASIKKRPSLVITDSQVFKKIAKIVPEDILLTSFSIVFARQRGELPFFISGVNSINKLKDHDQILIAEACTHHPQPEDIARVKLPKWLLKHTQKKLSFDFFAGGGFPKNLSIYKLIISCGGCMINQKEMLFRIAKAREAKVPMTNYGILIAYLNNILSRVTLPFKNKKRRI